MTDPTRPTLSRRAFGKGLAILPVLVPGTSGAEVRRAEAALRDAALRGLALADMRGDAVMAAEAAGAIARLAETDPEGAFLARLYRKLDVRPSLYWREDVPSADPATLTALHGAIADCRPVAFGYTDLEGIASERTVLPLALVHPPQGVKLLAWCALREGFRQFFVRSMAGLIVQQGTFADARLALLADLVEKEGA